MESRIQNSISQPLIELPAGGFIANIDKPKDWTSFDVVRKIRGITRIKKVGHAGTLDPFATGVLIICLGKATKKAGEFMQLPKEYVAELHLGQATDTLDVTGRVTAEAEIPALSPQQVTAAFEPFRGEIRQRIPDFSAAKIGGRRAYKMARAGQSVPERFKTVEIYQLELLELKENTLIFRVLCSRGTYVRTLGADIAEKLGTVGHLKNLRRTKIGQFTAANAASIDRFEQNWRKLTADESISRN